MKYSFIKRDKSPIDATTRMNSGDIVVSELSQTQKDKYSVILPLFFFIFITIEIIPENQSLTTVVSEILAFLVFIL